MSILKEILTLAELELQEILAIYSYGLRVYGCNSVSSDFDYIIIKKAGSKEEKKSGDLNISIYNERDFVLALNNCEISFLECLYLPQDKVIKNGFYPKFVLDKIRLRHSVSEKASHSFVKAKKKFVVEADKNIYVGKKSLFHSLRIVNFGIQIAKYGAILNYGSANNFWDEIMNNPSENWQDYNDQYKPILNNLLYKFRKVAPK